MVDIFAPTSHATQKTGLEAKPQPRPDKYAEAMDDWNQGREKLFDFAVKVAGIVGNYDEGETATMAKKAKVSVTTIQNYAKAGKLWIAFLQAYPIGENAGDEKYLSAEEYRDFLQISFWTPLGRQWANGEMSIGGVREWLHLAWKESLTVDQFRNRLPTSGGRSEYSRTVKQLAIRTSSLIEDIDRAMTDPAFDVDVKEYRKFQRALRLVKGRAANVMRQPASG